MLVFANVNICLKQIVSNLWEKKKQETQEKNCMPRKMTNSLSLWSYKELQLKLSQTEKDQKNLHPHSLLFTLYAYMQKHIQV